MILVAGSANLDFVVHAAHIPAPGETVLGRDFTTFPGGKGANQAVACARAGASATHMLLALGEDAFAQPLQASLQAAGVQLHTVRVNTQATGTAFICVSDDAQNAITVAPGANLALRAADLPPLAGFTHLLLQLEIPMACVLAYAQAAQAQGVKVVLNAAPAQALPAQLLALLDLLIVNQDELAVVAGCQGSVAQCLARISVPSVVVTLGQHGCCARADGAFAFQPAFEVTPVDTTGAGDTFCGVLVAALSQGHSVPQALPMASAAGALACTRAGAQTSVPARAEVLALLAAQSPASAAAHAALRRYCGFDPTPSGGGNAMTTPRRHKVIYDTDPGVDDAMALYFALAHPAIELLGITTTFGNVTVEQAASNARYLTAIAGKSVPVTRGVARPERKAVQVPPAHIHGADGLGNLGARVPTSNQLDPRPSAQFIVDQARAQPGQITLVAVGPLGNLSLALQMEPDLPRLLREVIVMGGTVQEPGNVSPVAEANVWNDPHAADHVFTAGCQLTMVGLDVTHQVRLPLSLVERIANHHQHRATDTLLQAVGFYARFYTGLYAHVSQEPGCFAHDVLAFIYLVQPDLFTLERGAVRVATDGLAQGQTVMNRRDFIRYAQAGWESDKPLTQVCMQVDAAKSIQLFSDTLMSAWLD